MKKEHKAVTRARQLLAEGKIYIASVVKSHMATTYYHLNKCEDVIKAGRWIPAPVGQYNNWHGRIGQSKVDWTITGRK